MSREWTQCDYQKLWSTSPSHISVVEKLWIQRDWIGPVSCEMRQPWKRQRQQSSSKQRQIVTNWQHITSQKTRSSHSHLLSGTHKTADLQIVCLHLLSGTHKTAVLQIVCLHFFLKMEENRLLRTPRCLFNFCATWPIITKLGTTANSF